MSFTPLLRRLSLLLACVLWAGIPALAQTACPPGQRPICLSGSCLCVPGSASDTQAVYDRVQRMAARNAITTPKGWTLWAAGERQEMRDLRSHFRALGLAREDVRVFGYWKHGASSSEIDRIRLREYAEIRKRGLRLEDLDDAELPI